MIAEIDRFHLYRDVYDISVSSLLGPELLSLGERCWVIWRGIEDGKSFERPGCTTLFTFEALTDFLKLAQERRISLAVLELHEFAVSIEHDSMNSLTTMFVEGRRTLWTFDDLRCEGRAGAAFSSMAAWTQESAAICLTEHAQNADPAHFRYGVELAEKDLWDEFGRTHNVDSARGCGFLNLR